MRARLWRTEGDRIACGLCPNSCLIAQGCTGVCGVRKNEAGVLVALTYGLISSVEADPIEKKPVFHYYPGTSVLSIGSVGCSMRCGHCQNWQISRARPNSPGSDLHSIDPETVVEMAQRYRCPGVAFTYNEPVIWVEFVADVAAICRERGLFTVMVTNGYITFEGLELLGDLIDVWRVDLKGSRDETYRDLCHVPGVGPVMRATEWAKHLYGMHVEVVTNVIPTVNDSADEVREMAEWIAEKLGPDTPWHITRFFPYLEFAHLKPTPIETLYKVRSAGLRAGLHFVYLGNVSEPGGADTICPACGGVAISRIGYTIKAHETLGGKCARCGQELGVVE